MIKFALLPVVALIIFLYKMDRIEKESTGLLIKLFLLGAATIISAMVLEIAGTVVLDAMVTPGTFLYTFIDAFIVVAIAEEGGKYFAFKIGAWDHKEFDHTFDAVVYAVVISLGFAAVENVLYVAENGLVVAVLRALTSVPGHAIFGLYMGRFLGEAKQCERRGDLKGKVINLRKAFIIPVLLHGFYDFCVLSENGWFLLAFLIFEIALTVIAYKLIKRLSIADEAL
jgi:RsiW-degrading membrane proteinase PrsW (M82 family)